MDFSCFRLLTLVSEGYSSMIRLIKPRIDFVSLIVHFIELSIIRANLYQSFLA